MKKHLDLNKINKCIQCYKCVRNCPTKAIKVTEDNVYEKEDLCIDCGNCAKVCTKNIHYKRMDYKWLNDFICKNDVAVILDSTFFMEINNYKLNQIEEAIIKAGFKFVKNNFDGLAIYNYLTKLKYKESKSFYFNSKCKPFLQYIQKYHPTVTKYILPYLTAQEISAKLLKEKYGDNIKIIYVTACYGDFLFENENSDIDKIILTSELMDFIKDKNITIEKIKVKSKKQKLYEIPGISTMSSNTITSPSECKYVINYAEHKSPKIDTSLMFYWCKGVCFNAPGINEDKTPYEREQCYFNFIDSNFYFSKNELIEKEYGDLERFKTKYEPIPIEIKMFQEDIISNVLKNINIFNKEEEYNCGACGYPTCRQFANAILNDMANTKQCVPYLMKINKRQSTELVKMYEELIEAFSLTIPDERLEKKLKSTELYKGIYDNQTDYLEITKVIKGGLYNHVINSLKLAADLKNANVFHTIGIDKATLTKAILLHPNGKTQPVLCVGDVVKYSDIFENKKVEASRSAAFAKQYYQASDDVCYIIKYQKHMEADLPDTFPKYLLPTFRLFKIIDLISSYLTKSEKKVYIKFEFNDFILYIIKSNEKGTETYSIDLYRIQDFNKFKEFIDA